MRIDRHLTLAVALWAIVAIVRGVAIIRSQSPCIDDNYHLYRGLLFLRGDLPGLRAAVLNDPPLGEALSAIPAWLHGVRIPDQTTAIANSLKVAPEPQYCFSLPDEIRVEIAIWKALLFLPMAAIVFSWVTMLYGHRAAWLSTVMLMCEPTLAAHMPLPTVDVLGVEGIVLGCWTAWRFVQRPTIARGAAAAIALAVALLLKHTAMLLPLVFVLYAAANWIMSDRRARAILPQIGKLAVVGAVALLLIWLLMQADFSTAIVRSDAMNYRVANFVGTHRLPLGTYWGSIIQAMFHDSLGHRGYLWGQVRKTGWWYYFPAVALYKIPLGIAAVLVLGIASLFWARPKFSELALLFPAIVWCAALSMQNIDIGFRHFLPPYIFLIMLSSRCLIGAASRSWASIAAWIATGAAAIHAAIWMPNELSYINFPREKTYLAISDSNVDWGQSIKQIGRWMQSHPDEHRPIYVGYFGPLTTNLYTELGPRLTGYSNRVFWLPAPSGDVVKTDIPEHGILILSPVLLTGQYEQNGVDRFARLRNIKPQKIIGGCMLVYDLDRLKS